MNISHHNCLWCNCQQHLPTDMSDVATLCGWDMKTWKEVMILVRRAGSRVEETKSTHHQDSGSLHLWGWCRDHRYYSLNCLLSVGKRKTCLGSSIEDTVFWQRRHHCNTDNTELTLPLPVPEGVWVISICNNYNALSQITKHWWCYFLYPLKMQILSE